MIDDLSRFNHIQREEITCYGKKETIDEIRSIFKYIFIRKERHFDIPQLSTEVMAGTIKLFGIDITPVDIFHGKRLIYGYKFLDCAYLTDCSAIPQRSMEMLAGLDILIIDGLRYEPHRNHFSFSEALDMIERLKPGTAY